MGMIFSLLASMASVGISAYLIPGVTVDNWVTVLLVAIFLGIVNTILKPILVILTLPINLLTLGLFTLVINAVLVLLVSAVVPGFHVDGFIAALLFSIVLSLVSSIVRLFVK